MIGTVYLYYYFEMVLIFDLRFQRNVHNTMERIEKSCDRVRSTNNDTSHFTKNRNR